MPKLSVIIATYNRAKFICKAIDSVLAQTYKDYEIIIVDDGSSDETHLLLQQYGDKIKYFYRSHQNQSVALNFAIQESTGEFIAFIDDDDVWLEDKLKIQMPLFERNPDLGIVGTGMYLTNELGEITSQWGKKPSAPETFDSLLEENFLGFPSIVLRKKFFNDVDGFDENLQTTQDFDLFLRMAKICQIKYIEMPLVKWRLHSRNKHKNKVQKLKDRLRTITKPENMAHFNFIQKRIRIAKEYYTHAEYFQNMSLFGLASITYLKSVLFCPWIGQYYWASKKNQINSSWVYRISKTYWRILHNFWISITLKPRQQGDCWSIGAFKLTNTEERLIVEEHASFKNPFFEAKHIASEKVDFVADPFLIKENNKYYLFFEIFSQNKGKIGLAESNDFKKWAFKGDILDESYHLSYPFIFNWQGKYYMLPECFESGSVKLYKAVNFPYQWRVAQILLKGKDFTDPSLFYHNNMFWIFVSDTSNSNLYLYYSDNLERNWKEHPCSPVIKNNTQTARPGGNIIQTENKLIRIAQDDSKSYGYAVRAFEIKTLNTKEYAECELPESPLLSASGKDWNKNGMHHLSVSATSEKEWVAVADGKIFL